MNFGNMGFMEILLILVVVLLLFGAKRLPEIGQSFGKSIREFKKGISDVDRSLSEDTRSSLPPRPADPIVQDELVQIGREALLNAFRHAHAERIEVVIEQATDGVRVRFIDDGRGIEPDVLASGGRHGHWGLAGMRERAERLGATLDIASRPAGGTCVEVRVPAALAYRSRSCGWQRWLRWRRDAKDGH